jgi:hypothetical protein
MQSNPEGNLMTITANEAIVASVQPGDTIEAQYRVYRNGELAFTRPVRITVDRTPWMLGDDLAAVTDGDGPTAAFASTIRIVGRECATCRDGCSCEGGVDVSCGHYACWGLWKGLDILECPGVLVERAKRDASRHA